MSDDLSNAFGSIDETGAKVGDTVVCVGISQEGLENVRYTKNRKYAVVSFCGRLCVEGNSHGASVGANLKWILPFNGYGAKWALVQ
jgi:hypothetical protein